MELRKYQSEALDRFENHYYTDDNSRGILSMCCGSGKTFTIYNIIKRCIQKYREKFFIIATSRSKLIEQTATNILNLCSKDNIDAMVFLKVSERFTIKDSLGNKYKNYDFLNTNRIADDIRLKLFTDNKICIIITTYQGSKDIVDAVSEYNKGDNIHKIVPDLVILDEAHNTAGCGENDIKLAQSIIIAHDESVNFTPQKYLFVTATPLKIIKQNSECSFINDDTTFSMDNPDIYGEVFYEYSFSNGIKDNCIVDWDTISLQLKDFDNVDVSDNLVVIKDQINSFEKEQQNIIHFRTTAALLIKMMLKYNLYNTIVFLSDQTQVNIMKEIINHFENPLFKVFTVISDNNKTTREKNIEAFTQFDLSVKKILLSVSIFDEGVDLPICDSIMFATPRSAETIIVQNIGRALRPYQNGSYIKKKAYVIIPTTIYNLEDCEESIYSTKFKKIREISDKMREESTYNTMYKRKIKIKGTLVNHNNDENVDEQSALIDEKIVVNSDEVQEDIKNITSSLLTQEVIDISESVVKSMNIVSGNRSIGNITLDTMKKLIRENNIVNLPSLGEFLKNRGIISIPHKDFKGQFICYSEIFYGNEAVMKFEDAKSNIASFINLDNIFEPKDWIIYCSDIFDKALQGTIENPEILKILMSIPQSPKEWYLNEWEKNEEGLNGWSNFLGKQLRNTTGIEVRFNKAPIQNNASNNISNYINNDHTHIKMYKNGDWNSYEPKTNLSEIVTYLKSRFGSHLNCYLSTVVFINNRGSFEKFVINGHIYDVNYKYVPFVIDVNYKIHYDRDIVNLSKIKDRTIANRTEAEYIQNIDIRNIITNLKAEIKQAFKK